MTRRHGPALSERSAASGVGARPTARHCTVVDGVLQWPGLLLEWRRDDNGWQGLVAYATDEPSGLGCRLLVRWLPAGQLEPTGHSPPE